MPRKKRSSLVSKQKANKRWCSEHYSHETDDFRKDETSISSALPERNMRCQTLEDSCLNDLNCCENSEAPHYVIMDVQFLKGLLKNLCDVCKSSTVKSLNDVRSQVKSSYQSNSAITDIDVTFDDTWLTRRHSSQIGVDCVIDLLTGFVMDFEIMSKRCIECEHAKSGLGENSAEFSPSVAALARGEVPGPHVKHVKTPLNETHLAKIMPIYQRLASNELLQRCIRCVTQNANESLHSIIWGKCSKETSATLRRVTIAVCDAVCEFNFAISFDLESLESKFGRGNTVAYRDCGLSFREIGSRVVRNQTTAMQICDGCMQKDTTDPDVFDHIHLSAPFHTPFTAKWSVRKTAIDWSTLDAEPQASTTYVVTTY
ncbi:uncharacterized protein TNCV_2470911 [Trichonephila clavipes]|nr:uncharacterized protein TNCV_2470911 [Trichonephila clavipes]